MNKFVIGLSFAGFLGLTACGGDNSAEPLIPDGTAGSGGGGSTALTKPIFAPGAGELPVPNDLLFGGTTDLTINIPVANPADFSNPQVALNGLDGWSAIAPFAISFRNDGNATGGTTDLNPATVAMGSSVRLFETNVFRPEVLPGVIAPTGPVTSVARELTPGVDYVAQMTAPLTVAVIPLRPFTPQASYMVVVTNGIADTNGNTLIADGQYAIAKTANPLTGTVAALEPVRQLVNAMENAATAFDSSLAKEDIILSYQFTVQSVGTVMDTAKLVYIDLPFSLGAITPSSFSSLFTTTMPFTNIGAADLYKGQVSIPYLLTAPSAENPLAPINSFWTTAEFVPTPTGEFIPNPGGAFGNLTYANKLPQRTGIETIPLLVSMPRAALGCDKPATGYPVMMFQHGITSNRTAMLGIADTMAAPPLCTAVVSGDMPLHGIDANNAVHLGLQAASGGALGLFEGYDLAGIHERTFGVDFASNTTGAPGSDDIPDSSGAHFINLTNLLVSRDNSREAIFNLLAIEKAVPFMDVDGDGIPDFDASQISYMGHSLGGIVGSSFVAYSDLIKSSVLANPGSGLIGLLNGSLAFGPVIRGGLASVGVVEGTAEFAGFMFAAQTVVDSGDPANTAARALTNDVPTLVLQVLNDAVVPNNVATAPLSGTEPLARLLETNQVFAEMMGEQVVGSRLFSKLNAGTHSTVLTPDDGQGNPIGLLNVTIEMQTQIATFIGSGGQAIVVSDPTLLDQ